MNLIRELSEGAEIGYAFLLPFVAILCWVPRVRHGMTLVLQSMNLWMAVLGAMGIVMILVGIASDFAGNGLGDSGPGRSYPIVNRLFGPYAMGFWLRLILVNVVPQVFWLRRVRRLPIASLAVCGGGWFVKFVELTLAANRDYLPSSWKMSLNISVSSLVIYVVMIAVLALFLWRRQEVADLKGIG